MASGGHPFPSDDPEESNSNLNPLQEGGNSSGVQPTRILPIANVNRIMRQVLPSHAKISDETKEFVAECAADFISFITGEANRHCQEEHRKTITAEDLLDTMKRLGFDEYADALTHYLQRYRDNASDARVGQQAPLHPIIPIPPYEGVLVAPPSPAVAAVNAPNPLPGPMEMGGFIGDEASGSGDDSNSASFNPMG